MFCTAKLSTSHGFTKGVSVDVSYLKMNDRQSDFTCNPVPTSELIKPRKSFMKMLQKFLVPTFTAQKCLCSQWLLCLISGNVIATTGPLNDQARCSSSMGWTLKVDFYRLGISHWMRKINWTDRIFPGPNTSQRLLQFSQLQSEVISVFGDRGLRPCPHFGLLGRLGTRDQDRGNFRWLAGLFRFLLRIVLCYFCCQSLCVLVLKSKWPNFGELEKVFGKTLGKQFYPIFQNLSNNVTNQTNGQIVWRDLVKFHQVWPILSQTYPLATFNNAQNYHYFNNWAS